MICYNCGAENDDNNILCYNCKVNLLAMDEDSDTVVESYLPYQEEGYQGGYNPPVNQKNSLALKLGIGISSVILLAVLIIGGILIHNSTIQTHYEDKLSEGNRYLMSMNYEAAIQVYLEALEINEKDPDLYIHLAEAYEAIGDEQSAIMYLRRGFQITRDIRINDLLTRYFVLDPVTEEATVASAVELFEKTDMSQVMVRNNIFNAILNDTYSDYCRDFGTADVVSQTDSELKITYANLMANTVFTNENGKGFDAATGRPVVDAKVSYLEFTNLAGLFSDYSVGITNQRIKELFGPDVIIKNEDGRYFLSVEYSGCRIEIETDEEGNIVSENAWNRITPLNVNNIDSNITAKGTASGKIMNAMTGGGIKAHLVFRQGVNMKTGDIIQELDCNEQGNYTVDLSEGKYTVFATANGFMDEYFTVNVVRGTTMANQNLTMSSTLSTGEVRIVLEWGSSPADLDSHLQGRTANGTNIHVSFHNKSASENGTTVAVLDVDDTTGFGPETTTIYNGDAGNYEFYVHDFTNGGHYESTALAESRATVKVYIGGQQPQIFNVPTGTGTVWHVFRIENGTITSINTIDNVE